MKRVRQSDINFKLNKKLINLTNFTIKFYTVNEELFFIRKTQDDVITSESNRGTNYYIKLEWSLLKDIGEGVLQYLAINNYNDSGFTDLQYNQSVQETTEYYIDSNFHVDPSKEKDYIELIEEIERNLDEEISRATSAETDLEISILAEFERATEIEGEISATVVSNYSALTTALQAEETRAQGQETTLNAKIGAETTRATTSENAISGVLDTYKASNDQALANEIARATSAETAINNDLQTEITARENIEAIINDWKINGICAGDY